MNALPIFLLALAAAVSYLAQKLHERQQRKDRMWEAIEEQTIAEELEDLECWPRREEFRRRHPSPEPLELVERRQR